MYAVMKLVRFGESGKERPGVLGEGRILDLRALDEGFSEIGEEFFEGGWLERARSAEKEAGESKWLDASGVRLGPPVVPSKVIALGLNYAEHAKEGGKEPPPNPIIFSKATTAIIGPSDDIVIPPCTSQLDWEVELAFVVGKRARLVEKEDALDYIAGYVCLNDVSARDAQFGDGQWHRGKSMDTFCPFGPSLVTTDELGAGAGAGAGLKLWSELNGELMQESTTDDLIFDVPRVLEFITEGITLLPGDIVSTGTPPGVGVFRSPPVFLKPGDLVEMGVEGIGELRNGVRE